MLVSPRSLVTLFLLPAAIAAQVPSVDRIVVPGLHAPVDLLRDRDGIPHLAANDEHDLYFAYGWVHAEDRLFQMDYFRRLGDGTLAELLGPNALGSDVQLRTIGIRRAAERSLAALSNRMRDAVAAYADGVNAYASTHPLPPEYQAVEVTRFRPWAALDSLTIAKVFTFSLSFQFDLDPTVALFGYVQAGQSLGFDGQRLFFDDLWRVAPSDPVTTIAAGNGPQLTAAAGAKIDAGVLPSPAVVALARGIVQRARTVPLLATVLDPTRRPGSNEWAVSGRLTTSGKPILSEDPHLGIDFPGVFHPAHLRLRSGALDVMGDGFAGVPAILLGHNRDVVWAPTNHYLDVTDWYQEQIVQDASSPSGLSTVYRGQREHVIPIPQRFFMNLLGNQVMDDVVEVPPGNGVPAFTLIVPRRNQGPIVDLDVAAGEAISVQWAGFAGTRELDGFLAWHTARDLADFRRGLQFQDLSQNWAYADTAGNIAYFVSGEVPVREDLQAGAVQGLPPWLIRNGTGGNEWLAVTNPQPEQALPFEILPAAELPHLVNPGNGWFVNANNDPIGTTLDNDPFNQMRPGGGIYYLSAGYDPGWRARRINTRLAEMLARQGRVSDADMRRIQADTEFTDARFFVPFVSEALRRASSSSAIPELRALAGDARVREAVERLSRWDFRSPTGLREGYDGETRGYPGGRPSPESVRSSVAATLYTVWRGRFAENTVDVLVRRIGLPLGRALGSLQHLLSEWEHTQGRGASGVDFFVVPGVAQPEDRRDVLVLQSLAEALDQLASEAFAPAFHRSTEQDDYRWGRLHRVTLLSYLSVAFGHSPFDAPPALGHFPPPLADLDGIPVDGGGTSVDVGGHPLRALDAHSFVVVGQPSRRMVCEVDRHWYHVHWSLAGSVSALPGHRHYVDLLPVWLANDSVRLRYGLVSVLLGTETWQRLVPR